LSLRAIIIHSGHQHEHTLKITNIPWLHSWTASTWLQY